jgi:fatty-acyl-CoA synthase
MTQSYVHGNSSALLLADTIAVSLNRAAAQWGERDALISCHQKLRYTYRELLDEVNRAARALLALGVERGDRVGIWSPNAAEWLITQYAAAKVGAILVNINPAYPTARAGVRAAAVRCDGARHRTALSQDGLRRDAG